MDSSESQNPFAIALAYYDRYKRSTLQNPDFLLKIAAKYSKKPEKLIPDLLEKYCFPSSLHSISFSYLFKIISTYKVPTIYVSLLGLEEGSLPDYDSAFDIFGNHFDPEKVLQYRLILASKYHNHSYDNINRFKPVIQGDLGPLGTATVPPTLIKHREAKEPREKELSPLDTIMNEALQDAKSGGVHGPTLLLKACVDERSRIHVVIRRRRG